MLTNLTDTNLIDLNFSDINLTAGSGDIFNSYPLSDFLQVDAVSMNIWGSFTVADFIVYNTMLHILVFFALMFVAFAFILKV